MKNDQNIIGKIIYSLVFLLLLPAILWGWAKFTEHLIHIPAIQSPIVGWALIGIGILLMLSAMYALKKYGKGLPMNAYPPPVFVTQGVYKLFSHPIYVGFVLLIVGYFILTGYSSGLWLITPITILGIIALVLGYENIDIKSRFPGKTTNAITNLPVSDNSQPSFSKRVVASLEVLVLVLLSNFIILHLVGAIHPIWGGQYELLPGLNETITVLSSVVVIVVPFIINQNNLLRKWLINSFLGIALGLFLSILYPSIGAQYIQSTGWPVLSVSGFLILVSTKTMYTHSRKLGIVYSIPAIPILILLLANSKSAILHTLLTVILFLFSVYYMEIWSLLRSGSEKIANSWHEWTFGKIRVINHGFYVGFGAFLGIFITGILVGDAYAWAILVFAVVVIIFSALWAQIIEGSEKLKRPYGYYGALVGIIFASFVVWLMGFNVWILIGVISVVMPWVQAIGRLRCLINGCCHGGEIKNPLIGIRYYHHRSRVCGISGLKGKLLHPTPLYSILWLFVVGLILLGLWNHGFSSPFIFGMYLILTGIGRFVEEAYRGEVQTPIVKGLRLYQWTALFSVIIGIAMTPLKVNDVFMASTFGWESIVSALIGGLFTMFAMGVDFPYSNARFSRLV